MKCIKVYLILSSIFGLVLGGSPVKAESFIQDACQQIVGTNSSSEVVQVVLADEPISVSSNALPQVTESLELRQQKNPRWSCKYVENGKWFSLFDISIKEEKQVIASTFLLNGKFKPNQKDAAISFLTNVIAETLSLGGENQQRVRDALAGYLTLINEGSIIPDQLDQETLSQQLQQLGISLSQIPSRIPDSWVTDDAIPVDKLVIFDGSGEPQAVAYTYMVPIVDLEKKDILQWGINITVDITAKQGFKFKNPLESHEVGQVNLLEKL